ncbi:hypothetical protein [Christensenella minuta]|jgi:hypothetical protein|uniref:Uncharacterized protein n=1 Tax=Christensenella minuta TaxID=626937 RepID=A0A136Q702_9FIRM|nr:hypothetical protein [Christensenella minuta]KXK66430.1 hypothetical protein HMPREF3293_00729 [Christensenella minuta]
MGHNKYIAVWVAAVGSASNFVYSQKRKAEYRTRFLIGRLGLKPAPALCTLSV